MQFLKTVFWVLIAVVVALFVSRNGSTVVQLNLWGDIQADIKLPILLLVIFLIGFLPTWLIMRTRVWSHRRRIEAMERNRVTSLSTTGSPEEEGPAI
jgi:lipopolysaccharide assembly protein A